eukprot:34417_1
MERTRRHRRHQQRVPPLGDAALKQTCGDGPPNSGRGDKREIEPSEHQVRHAPPFHVAQKDAPRRRYARNGAHHRYHFDLIYRNSHPKQQYCGGKHQNVQSPSPLSAGQPRKVYYCRDLAESVAERLGDAESFLERNSEGQFVFV